MLNTKFNYVLKYNPQPYSDKDRKPDAEIGGDKLKKIKYHTFEKSEETLKYIKEAGLEKEIGSSIVTEKNYKIKKIVGYGATSVVYKASHQHEVLSHKDGKPVATKKKETVAVKKIKNVFSSEIYAHRVLRELRLLRLLKGHNNVSKNFDLN